MMSFPYSEKFRENKRARLMLHNSLLSKESIWVFSPLDEADDVSLSNSLKPLRNNQKPGSSRTTSLANTCLPGPPREASEEFQTFTDTGNLLF